MTGARARRVVRRLGTVAAVLAALLLALAAGLWLYLRASLPRLDGEVAAPGLAAPVELRRDALGSVTVVGRDRGDLAWATGYAHAQDRYFQMDLLRRAGAGELAALLGSALVPADRQRRIHRFRARAEAALAAQQPAMRRLLERYADGVNRGLADLGARPFEYALLRRTPAPWQPVDALLVGYAMYFDLQDDQFGRLLARHLIGERGTSAEQWATLQPAASRFDAPLDADGIEPAVAPWPARAPAWLGRAVAPGTGDRRATAPPSPDIGAALPGWLARATEDPDPLAAAVGSNNAAIAGRRSVTGAAIVSNDMHLQLRLPNIWYRLSLQREGSGPAQRVTGVSLPGTPAIVAGSNGRVAWGYTNSYGRYVELVRLVPSATVASGPAGIRWQLTEGSPPLPTERRRERIDVAGGEPVWLTFDDTPLGPLVERGNATWLWRWVAHEPGAVDLGLVDMEDATDVDAALAVARRAGVPAQNLVVGDAAGRIAWTVAGRLPPAAEGGDTAAPRVVDPPSGQLVTANSRTLADPAGSARIGDVGMDLGARTRQLRDDLRALGDRVDEAAVHAALLDDRALYLAAWRERALRVLAAEAASAPGPSADAEAARQRARRAEFARVLAGDASRAVPGSAAYTLARAYATGVYRRLFDGIDAELRSVDRQASVARAAPRWPAFALRLLQEQPAGWLPDGAADWADLERQAVDRAIASLESAPGSPGMPLEEATWGRHNTAQIAHPLAGAIPGLGRLLQAPARPQAGDNHMPRVAGPSFGASERFVVSPGHEARGLFSMPGGASGHPLSPWFMAGHAAWADGRTGPFLPGAAQHTLRVSPAAAP